MDLDAVADELYGLLPSDFTAVRNERAKAARDAGDRHLAEQIRRLRRPTLAAWASNLLVRKRPQEIGPLLELGQALRRAHQELNAEQLRELSDKRWQVISALARQAGTLTAQAGRRISEDAQREVKETLQAVLGDPAAARQWGQGRLTKPLTVPVTGFTVVTGNQRAPERPRPKAASGRLTDLDTAGHRRKQQLERARRQASDAERELQEREDELAAAHDAQRQAKQRQQHAEQRVADLTQRLKKAEDERRQAQAVARQARDRARRGDRAVREARRRAQDAAAHVRELSERVQPPR
ncbi:hypothetical protein [Nonomuraea sp. SYSU D8015]|uniref:hypothetical protein n=1 Tax=Nonomuraea sp. SYSU D8015 TaxID=2593644 RepID=UPI001660D4BF|nr:hypothetical protein [Nonomuraea sp. SYSU D8015]